MYRTVLLAAAIALATAGSAAATPRPVPGGPYTGCDAVSVPNGAQVTGVLYGSVAAADFATPAGNPVDVRLTCTVQSGGYAHSDLDDHTASKSGVAVAVVKPSYFSVPAPANDLPIGVCSRVDVSYAGGATTTYWSHSQNSTWRTTDDGTCSGAPQCLAFGPDCVWWLALIDELT